MRDKKSIQALSNYNVLESNKKFLDNKAMNAISKNEFELLRHYLVIINYDTLKNTIFETCLIDKKTVLQIAYDNANYKMIKFLIKKGINPNIKDDSGNTLLHHMFLTGSEKNKNTTLQEDAKLFGYLLCNKFDLEEVDKVIKQDKKKKLSHCLLNNPIDKQGFNILHLLASILTNVEDNMCFAKYLIDQGIDVDIPTPNNEISLSIAAIRNNKLFFNFLIHEKADVNFVNNHGNSVINRIVKYGEKHPEEYIQALFQNNADINLCSNQLESPLLTAFHSYNVPSLHILINLGAKIPLNLDKNIFNKKPQNYNHEICQNLLLQGIAVQNAISEEQIKLNFTTETKPRYREFLKNSYDEIKTIIKNIIISSENKKILLERNTNLQKTFDDLFMKCPVNIPSKLMINCLEAISKKPFVTHKEKASVKHIFENKSFGFKENNVTTKLINEILSKSEFPITCNKRKFKVVDNAETEDVVQFFKKTCFHNIVNVTNEDEVSVVHGEVQYDN